MAYLSRVTAVGSPLARQVARRCLNQSSRRTFLPSRYDPFEEMQRNMDRMMREFDRHSFPFRSFFKPMLGRAIPIETCDNGQRIFKIEIDLPDFKPEDIQVTVTKGEIIINAKSEHNDSNLKQNRVFNYRYSLPEDADLDKVRSSLKTDGRLVIEAPLPQIEAKADKEIPITLKK